MQTYTLESLRRQLAHIHADNSKMAYDDDFVLFEDITEIPLHHTPTRTEMAVFGLCLEGGGMAEVDGRQLMFERNSYFIMLPHQVVNLPQQKSVARGIFICVSTAVYEELMLRMQELLPLFFYIREHPCATLRPADVRWIEQYHIQIFREMHDTRSMFRRQITRSLLVTLLYKVSNIYGSQLLSTRHTTGRMDDIFTQFLKLLADNVSQHHDLTWYANQLCVTPKYMSGVIKKVSGQTANSWIQNYTVQEAKRLLCSTSLDIKQIASRLSFPSQSFFGKYFKHQTGMSPSVYRALNKLA